MSRRVTHTGTLICALPVLAVLLGCSTDSTLSGPGDAESAPPRVVNVAGTSSAHLQDDWFVDHATFAGLNFLHFNGMSGEFYFPEMIPPGAGLLDFDNDGDLDIYLVQGAMLGPDTGMEDAVFPWTGSLPLRGRLFRNDLDESATGSMTPHFTDVTDTSGIDAQGYGMGVAAGDIDNDGWVDLYLTYLGRNQLFKNNGDGTFLDISTASGTDDPGWGVSASFLDYDRDGWLDLYVGNYVRYDLAADVRCARLTGERLYCGPEAYPPQSDRLYRNQGDGTFENVTSRALRSTQFGPALGVSTADFDGDGWIDIYVANDQTENLLWINQRDGTFVNNGMLSGTSVNADGEPEGSMGVDAGDSDNDGDEDLVMTHVPEEGHNLYVNLGSGLFEDASAPSRVHMATLGYTGWGTAWFDYDNDGWLDVLTVNGAFRAIPALAGDPFPYGERNVLLRNAGNGTLEDVTETAGAVFQLLDVSRGAAFGDIDNDGDIDVLVSNTNGPPRLMINQIDGNAHWLGLRLLGADARRDMVGATVKIQRPGEPLLSRRARADGSYASANAPRVHVGLGSSDTRPSVRVTWPDGSTESWTALAIDRWTTLIEGTGTAR